MICNVSEAISQLGNSEKLFIKHFNNFKEKYATAEKDILKLVEAGEYNECARLCHSIKGISGMLVLEDLFTDIVELENLLKARETEDKIMAGYLKVKNDLEGIRRNRISDFKIQV